MCRRVGYATAVMANRVWFDQVDLWARRLLAPPSAQTPQVSTHDPTQASQRFFSFATGFLATSAMSLALVTVHRGGLIPISHTALCRSCGQHTSAPQEILCSGCSGGHSVSGNRCVVSFSVSLALIAMKNTSLTDRSVPVISPLCGRNSIALFPRVHATK